MKKFSLVILLLGAIWSLFGQTGSIAGVVKGLEGPLDFAAVQLQGAEWSNGLMTDAKGRFVFEEAPVGDYQLIVQRLGFQPKERSVEVKAGETVELEITLAEDRLNLNEVVVSATRYDLGKKEAPVVVQVMDEQLFNASQSVALSESLSFQPGVRVETNCQNCGFTQVRLNGLDGAYSQILINNRPVFSALNSVYGLDQIPTNIIDRVEVVRGGGSALFGSNAIAGTINIITKEPILNTWQVNTNFALVNGDTPDNTVNLNASVVNDKLDAGVTFFGMYRSRDAFDANGDGFTELVRLENNTFGAKAFFRPDQQSKITVDFNALREYRRGGDRLELAPHFTDITEELDHNTLFGGISYDRTGKDERTHYSAYFSGQTTQRDSYYGGLGGGRSEADSIAARNAYGTTDDLALVAGLKLSRRFLSGDVLTVGLENQYNEVLDEITGYNRLVDQRVNALGAYGQYEWRPGKRLTVLAGARYDFTRVDGQFTVGNIERIADVELGVFSPRLTLLYDLSQFIQLRGGYARGFRAPQAFNEDLHIASVGGEPQFVVLSDELDKELSDAFTASVNYTRTFGAVQTDFLLEGFHTVLRDPFTIVSTGAALPGGSIVEEVRNGTGAAVSGVNFELNVAPSGAFLFQAGGTVQQARYDEAQVLFEPEPDNPEVSIIATDQFVRTPEVYGYLFSNWQVSDAFGVDLTGAYTGSMIVPRVISDSGLLALVDSDPFFDLNLRLNYQVDLKSDFHLEISGGVQNIFDSFQDDFDTGPGRDSDYIYGPARPRTFFLGVKVGNFR